MGDLGRVWRSAHHDSYESWVWTWLRMKRPKNGDRKLPRSSTWPLIGASPGHGPRGRAAPEASFVIAWLHRQSIDVWMCTGDSSQTADAVALQVGLSRNRVRAGQLPRDKRDLITELQNDGLVVFVGDGVNDAPALAQADVGVALGAGSGVAVEAADVVLVGDDLRGVSTALDLARHTYNSIRLNFAWATWHNLVLSAGGGGAFYPATQQRPPAGRGGGLHGLLFG